MLAKFRLQISLDMNLHLKKAEYVGIRIMLQKRLYERLNVFYYYTI